MACKLTIILFCTLAVVWSGYFSYRILWVYEKLYDLVHNNRSDEYLDFESMLIKKFWVWDIEKLRK